MFASLANENASLNNMSFFKTVSHLNAASNASTLKSGSRFSQQDLLSAKLQIGALDLDSSVDEMAPARLADLEQELKKVKKQTEAYEKKIDKVVRRNNKIVFG